MTLAEALHHVYPCLHADPAVVAIVRDAAVAAGVPCALMASVCFVESRFGRDPRALSLCGVRLRGRYVRDAGRSAAIGARSLARHHARCRTWPSALIAWHQRGRCADRDDGFARNVLGVWGRLALAMGR